MSDSQRGVEALWEAEARFQAILSSLDDLVFELDEHGTYLDIWTSNDALLIAPRSELIGRTHAEALGEEMGLQIQQIIDKVLETGRPDIWEYCLEVPAGRRWFQGRVAPIIGAAGSTRRICLLVRDITARKDAEEEILRLLSREQLLSRLSEALPVGLFEIDAADHIVFTNDIMHAMTGTPPAPTLTALMSTVFAEDRQLYESSLASALADKPVDDVEIRLHVTDPDVAAVAGNERVCALSMRALTDATGAVTGVVGCLSDVTEHVQFHRELEVRAMVDKLTSCLNRQAALELVERIASAPKMPGEGNALIYVDLDQFKSVNDRFGHAAGDRFLVAASDRLRGTARRGDAVGRVGGDEFVVICPGVASPNQAVKIAERIASATKATIDVGVGEAELRTSVGVAWTAGPIDADAFLAQADSAMYASKRAQSDGVTLFVPPESAAKGTPMRRPAKTRQHPRK
ncbi:MAG: diguanylate cyclase [Acidimicrobiales bacterium]|jgi:diguanylate cyclase (GGDEF)-like protein/PAS domain S-box-containing protein